MRVTIFMPVMNEEQGCEKIIPQIKKEWYDQMIVVDNNSKDKTVEVCKNLGAEVISQKGKGLNAAYREVWPLITGDIVITFSPDGNSVPEKIPELIEKMKEGYDMVIASRYKDDAKSYDDTILTGCYADWLFKGIALDRKQFSFFNKKLPLYDLKNFDYDFFSKRTQLDKKYEELIKKREDIIFSDKETHIKNEICRIFPLFQEETAATRLTLQQLFPWDSIFSDNDLIEVYQEIPTKYKINSEVYDKAVSLILNKVENIPHSGKRHKIGINKYYGTLIYLIRVKIDKILKLLRIKKVNLLTGDGSWMSSKKYATDKEFKSLWMNMKNFKLFKDMLKDNDLDFHEILKKDTKLIFKCIVLDKFISQNKEKDFYKR